jgi:hypothetical protein
VLAAHLERAGYKPVFYRPPDRKPIADHGSVENRTSGAVLSHAIRTVALLPFDLSRFKAAAVLVRYESLATVLEELGRRDGLPPLAVFTPVLFPAELHAIAMRASTAACFPEIAALPPEKNRVVYSISAAQELLTAGANPLASVLWADLLNASDLKAFASERPLGELCAKYAFGIPLLLALENSGYDTRRLARDRPLLRTAWSAAREGLDVGRGKGALPRFWIRALARLPSALAALAASAVLFILPSFSRQMLEEHFRKVSEQTRLACGRLAENSPEGSALRRLLG